jgi:hypothetical protein
MTLGNRVMRIFGPKIDEVTGGWRTLYNEDDGDCGEIGGMKIGRGNRNTRTKPAPAPLCPPQIPHD